ncbi:MAG: T9SS type A sorting domain-containing protein [Hyphomicrobiales bacterium]
MKKLSIILCSVFIILASACLQAQKDVNSSIQIGELQFRVKLAGEVEETSGIIFWRNSIWTHNDSYNAPVIYRLNTETGEVTQRVTVSNAKNIDWEEITQDDDYIYIGDFGNNDGNRKDLRILKIAKDQIPESGDVNVEAEKIGFTYSGYTSGADGKKHNWDCEAMMSKGEYLYLFSKNRGDERTYVYRLPKSGDDYILNKIAAFNVNGLITGADYSEDSKVLVLSGYPKNYKAPFIWLFWEFDKDNFFGGKRMKINYPDKTACQVEGVCFSGKNQLFLSSEENRYYNESLFTFDIEKWLDGTNSLDGLERIEVPIDVYPNPIKKGKLNINLSDLLPGDYQICIRDMNGVELFFDKYRFKKKDEKFILKVDVNSLPSGTYLLTVRSDSQYTVKKVIIQ